LKITTQAQVIFVILSVAGIALALFSTSVYGAGLSPDSVTYIFAANRLLSGDDYMNVGGTSYALWAPLFPALLAGLGLLGIEPLDGVRFFNAVIFGLIIFTTGHLLRSHLRTWTIVILGTASLLVSVIILRVSIMAWSEPLFVLLAILFVIYLSKYLNDRRIKFLMLISILAAFACLQRYLGFTLVLTGFISIAFFMRSATFQSRLKYLIFFGLISTTPIAIWFARNYWFTSSFAGNRRPSSTGLLENIGDILYSSSSWLVPASYVTTAPIKIFFVVLGVSIITALVTVALRSHLRQRSSLQLPHLAPAATFVAVYIFSLLIIRTNISFYAPVGDRLLSPVYIFVLLFVLLGIEKIVQTSTRTDQQGWNSPRLWIIFGSLLILSGMFFNEWTISRLLFYGEVEDHWVLTNLLSADGAIRLPFRVMILAFGIFAASLGAFTISLRRKTWIGRFVIVGLFCVWLMYPVGQTYIYVSTKTDTGAGGFNSDGWRNSTLTHWLKANPLDGAIYTNDPYAIYILTQTAATSSPSRFPYSEISRSSIAASRFRAAIATDVQDTYLVWIENDTLLDPKRAFEDFGNIFSMFDLEEIARFADGGIYLFN